MTHARRAPLLALTILLLALLTPTNAAPKPAKTPAANPPAVPVQRRPGFLPLGVYWPGEATFRDAPTDTERWRKIDTALAGMAKHHINAIWLVNENTIWAAELARHAAKHNIFLVAATNELEGKQDWVRTGDHAKLLAQTRQAWGDAPPPIAWGLSDEPPTDILPGMTAYAADWHRYAPGELTTAVVPWNVIAPARTLPVTALAADVYVFFTPGSPLGYSYGSDWNAWETLTQQLVAATPRAWMMGQACQEAIGPYNFDAQGNLVYLPTAVIKYVTPTPAQIKWQAWSAFALGAKGIFFYHYALPDTPQPSAAVSDALAKLALPGTVHAPTNSHAPQGLVYADGRTTPQYEALGDAYAQLARLAPTLAPLKPELPSTPHLTSPPTGGAIAAMLVNPQTAKRYLLVVAPYTGSGPQTLTVTLDPQTTALLNILTGQTTAVRDRTAALTLSPGDGALYECLASP